MQPPSTAGSLRPLDARRTICRRPMPGTSGAPISPSAPGAPYARTTATMAMPGASFPMIMHDPGRTGGMKTAGLSDIHHDLCLALALWNGVDPILKERMFRLTGPQGNRGEDVKEYWWYLDG